MPKASSVLIVDDDAETRACLEGVFQEEGCRVATAENGKRALEILEHFTPDLMLVDLVMPIMSGWDLCAALERDERLAAIPVVILSSVSRFRPLGRNRVLSKPVKLDTVLALLDYVDCP
jgi:CheY-like chemotaxis protein